MAEDDGPVFPKAPPERIELPGGRALVRMSADRTTAVVASINSCLDHLSPWMAWAAEPATEAGMAVFLAAGEELWDQRRDFGYAIVEGDEVIGGSGLHGRQDEHGLDIGYWVHVDRIGLGIASDVTRALTNAAFEIPGIERVRIQCDERNVRSARVPEKLGYRLDGLSDACDKHPGRETTMEWLVERDDWIAKQAATGS